VLVLLFSDTDVGAVRNALSQSHFGWLALAFCVKSAALVLHEVRLWLAFNPPRPPARKTVAIGLAAGLLNTVLPLRAGDVAAIAMLRRQCGVRVGAATAAVGVSSFLEAAVFGGLLGTVLVVGAARWREIVGAAAHADAVQWVTASTLGGTAVAVAAVLVGRRLGPPPDDGGPPLATLLRDTLTQTGDSLGVPTRLAMHVGLAAVDVTLTVAGFTLLLPVLDIQVAMPVLAASGVLAISAVASVVLPPTYGAGPAAASVAVLAAFGVEQPDALAYAAGYWLLSQGPAVVLGLPCLLGRGARRTR
jgi:hypothetical protein